MKKVTAIILSFLIVFTSISFSHKKSYAIEPVTMTATSYFVLSALAAAGMTAAVCMTVNDISDTISWTPADYAAEAARAQQFKQDLSQMSKEFYDYMQPSTKTRWQDAVGKSTIIIPYDSPLFPKLNGDSGGGGGNNNGPDKKVMVPIFPDSEMIDEFFDFIFDYHKNGKNERLKKQIGDAIAAQAPTQSELDKELLKHVGDIPATTSTTANKFVSSSYDYISSLYTTPASTTVIYLYNVYVSPKYSDGSYQISFTSDSREFISYTDHINPSSSYTQWNTQFSHFSYQRYFIKDVDYSGSYSNRYRVKSCSIRSMGDAYIPKIQEVNSDQKADEVKKKGNHHFVGDPFTVTVPVPQRHLAPFPSEIPGTRTFDPSRIPFPLYPQKPADLPDPNVRPDYIPSTMPEVVPQPEPGTQPQPQPQPQPGDNPYPFPIPNPAPGTQPEPGTNPFPYPYPAPFPNPGTNPDTGTNPDAPPGTQPQPSPFGDDVQVPGIDFSPLMNTLPRKFPFCIPFDFFDLIRSFSYTSNFEPVWELELYENKFVLDLRFITPYVNSFKNFFFLIYLVGLIHVTRSLIKW